MTRKGSFKPAMYPGEDDKGAFKHEVDRYPAKLRKSRSPTRDLGAKRVIIG